MGDVHLVRGSNPYFSLKNKYLLQIKKLKEDMAKLEIISLKKAKDYISTFFGNFGDSLFYFPTRRDFPSFFFTV